MNIGLINEYYPPYAPGGAEWSTQRLAQALAEGQAHRVVVITPRYGTAPAEDEGAVCIRRFPVGARLQPGGGTVALRHHASPLFYLCSAAHICRIARAEHLDVLHAQNKYSLPGAWLAGRLLGIPVLLTLRDTAHICPLGRCLLEYDTLPPGCGRGRLWRQDVAYHMEHYMHPATRLARARARLTLNWLWLDCRLRRFSLARADGVVAVSQGILDLHRAAGLRLGREARVVYNLPPEEAPPPSPAELAALRAELGLGPGPVALFVGRISPGKGAPTLLEAAPRIAGAVPGAQVVLVGPGTCPPADPHVRALGPLEHPTVLRLYHLADVVVVPSVWPEPLSRVLLEALAAGRPVVGTRTGGTPEIIDDGVNGYLVARRDAAALADAVVAVLADPALGRAMGRAGQRIAAERFDPARSLGALLDFYRCVGARG